MDSVNAEISDVTTEAPQLWERLAILRVDVVAAANLPVALRRGMLSAEIAHLIARLSSRVTKRGLTGLQRTDGGLVVVYSEPGHALAAARTLRLRKTGTGLRVRYGLHWGDVRVGDDGLPIGGETEMLGALLALKREDRITSSGDGDLPDRELVLASGGTVAQLPEDLRAQFVPNGRYRVLGYVGALEIWTEALSVYLGREPTYTEQTFGVSGLDTDTLLDVRWSQRYLNLDRRMNSYARSRRS